MGAKSSSRRIFPRGGGGCDVVQDCEIILCIFVQSHEDLSTFLDNVCECVARGRRLAEGVFQRLPDLSNDHEGGVVAARPRRWRRVYCCGVHLYAAIVAL